MSGQIRSKIINNNLELYLDANNPKSYTNTNIKNWKDLSKNGNNFVLQGTTSVPEYDSNGLLFNGNNQDARPYLNYVIDNDTKTISGFIKLTDDTTIQGIIGTRNSNTGFGIAINYVGPGSMIGFNINGGSVTSAINTYPTNEWYHFAYTFNSSTGNMALYKNGILVITSTGHTIGTTTTATKIVIGSGTGHAYFKGYIGMIQYYNVALNETEILQNYEALKSIYGL